jgi:hypothetical protein
MKHTKKFLFIFCLLSQLPNVLTLGYEVLWTKLDQFLFLLYLIHFSRFIIGKYKTHKRTLVTTLHFILSPQTSSSVSHHVDGYY